MVLLIIKNIGITIKQQQLYYSTNVTNVHMTDMIKNNKITIQIFVGVIVIAAVLFAYLTWYVSPDEVTEKVKVIANTEDGCIAESFDGFAINIGQCDAQAGDVIVATYDAKIKERAILMNPTR